jgi:hypothetical protein
MPKILSSDSSGRGIKVLLALLVLLACLNGLAFAQGSSGEKDKPSPTKPLVVIRTITGTVKFAGNELTLVDDADGKPWNIINPDAVKQYQGQHVQITGHAFTDRRALHAHTVEVVKGRDADARK